jgi:hypothetical protein
MVTKAYDVSDLTTLPGEHVAQLDAGGALAGSPGPAAPPNPAVRYPQQDPTQLGQLRSLIMQTVEPGSWSEAGGAGSIGTFGTKLIVKNSEPIHKEITELLTMLREKPANKTQTPRQ